MVNVIVLMKIKEGKAQEFIANFKEQAKKVKQEKGCIDYFPAVDVKMDTPMAQYDPNSVTIIERWESIETLNDHLVLLSQQPPQNNEAQIVESATMKVVEEA